MKGKEKTFWFHWQNLNVDKFGRKKNPLKYGRCWWHFGYNKCLNFEWSFGKIRFGLGVRYGGCEDELSFQFSIPLVSLYLNFDGFFKNLRKKEEKHTGIDIFDKALWIDIGQDEHSWSPKRDKWRHIVIHPIDILLGRTKYKREELQKTNVEIPMPEKAYPAEVILTECIWKRPRSIFKKVVKRADIEMTEGIPVPGKGENSWDIGNDAISSLTIPDIDTIEGAIAGTVKSCLRDRFKYGGYFWRPEEDKKNNEKEKEGILKGKN